MAISAPGDRSGGDRDRSESSAGPVPLPADVPFASLSRRDPTSAGLPLLPEQRRSVWTTAPAHSVEEATALCMTELATSEWDRWLTSEMVSALELPDLTYAGRVASLLLRARHGGPSF